MAQEARRGCGFRKVGGLYLCGDNVGVPCCKLPIELHVCPTCNAGVKQTRATYQWIDPKPWLTGECTHPERICPASNPEVLGKRVGLLWIGAQFYPRPEDFLAEAAAMGISRRINTVPRGFKLGETWVFLAHPRVKQTATGEWIAGIFRIFRPTRIEKIVTESQAADAEEMEKLHKTNITPVAVPDGDSDHRGTVYDRPGTATQFEFAL